MNKYICDECKYGNCIFIVNYDDEDLELPSMCPFDQFQSVNWRDCE